MSVHTVTALTNAVGPEPILHLTKLKGGVWVAACGTRVNNAELWSSQFPDWINCGKCRAKLRKEGIVR